jgi:hypothetical protein
VTQSGSGVTATDAGFNGALSPGTSTSFGFIGTWGSANNAPTNVACTSS